MTRVMKGNGPKGGKPKLICTRAKRGAGCEYHAIDLPTLERALREGLGRVLEDAPSADEAVDAEVRSSAHDLEAIETPHFGELMERGRSPALSSALANLEARKAEAAAKLRDAVSRQSSVSPASQERRRAELYDALTGPVDVLNAKLRGVFGRVLPDHRDGRVYFRWLDGSESGASLVFGWPTVDA